MLRLSPPNGARLAQCQTFETWLAGSESNVAGALRVLGKSVTWASRLPDHALGRKIESGLRAWGIDVSAVVWAPPTERVGVFYYEPGAAPRSATVVYDRAGSAASFLSPANLPDSLFEMHRHLHVSGITPALSASCAETVGDAVHRAKARGMTVSFDVNYRAKLWTPIQAAETLTPLLRGSDIVLCSRDDARLIFGCSGDAETQASGMWEEFGGPDIIITAGADGAVGCAAGKSVAVPAIAVPTTVERLGSGDAFAAGFLAAFLDSEEMEQSLRLGVATAALKLTVPGDMLIGTRDEIEALRAQTTGASWR